MLKKIARLRVPLGFVFGILVIVLARPTLRSLAIGGAPTVFPHGLPDDELVGPQRVLGPEIA